MHCCKKKETDVQHFYSLPLPINSFGQQKNSIASENNNFYRFCVENNLLPNDLWLQMVVQISNGAGLFCRAVSAYFKK